MEFPSRGGDRPGDGDDNAAARVKGKGEGRLANAIMEKRIELCRPSSSLIFWRFALTLFDGLRCLISQFTFVLTLESKHAGSLQCCRIFVPYMFLQSNIMNKVAQDNAASNRYLPYISGEFKVMNSD
ncbi:uncharacterized protein LOC110101579 isoform X1 [Dendrobium catenatum]|uniref:uncharacterized protein LOC110101579 isoform X1 n=1 Tax=Dendrobium catenatum TaxID=906689 RepID=UPI0010A06C58|nr:uncharacterized protein LOC110101579 isoform X1 [Dendrobium catenatum]